MNEYVKIRDEMVKEFLRVFLLNIIYFFSGDMILSRIDKTLLINRGLIFSVSLIVSSIYLICIFIIRFLTKPINISIELKNKRLENNYNTIVEFKDSKLNLVAIHVHIHKTKSIWNLIGLKLLKNKKITLEIGTEPHHKSLVCQPISIVDGEVDILNNGTTFYIDVSDLIFNNLENQVPHKPKYEFIIVPNRDKTIKQSQQFVIKPKIRINNQRLSFIQNRLLDFKFICDKENYTVDYIYY